MCPANDQAIGVAVFLTMLAFVFQLTYTAAARGEDKDEVQASAALALAKAKREREQAKARASAAISCHTDYDKAVAEAERTGKSLVLWVGVTCESHPELRRALGNAVHCHMKERRGQKEPGIVIMGGDGIEYVVRPEKIKSTTADKIKEAWRRRCADRRGNQLRDDDHLRTGRLRGLRADSAACRLRSRDCRVAASARLKLT